MSYIGYNPIFKKAKFVYNPNRFAFLISATPNISGMQSILIQKYNTMTGVWDTIVTVPYVLSQSVDYMASYSITWFPAQRHKFRIVGKDTNNVLGAYSNVLEPAFLTVAKGFRNELVISAYPPIADDELNKDTIKLDIYYGTSSANIEQLKGSFVNNGQVHTVIFDGSIDSGYARVDEIQLGY